MKKYQNRRGSSTQIPRAPGQLFLRAEDYRAINSRVVAVVKEKLRTEEGMPTDERVLEYITDNSTKVQEAYRLMGFREEEVDRTYKSLVRRLKGELSDSKHFAAKRVQLEGPCGDRRRAGLMD
jgi:hypothetical protein